jgi:hypothetical protein
MKKKKKKMTFQTEQYWKEQIFYGMFVRAQILLAYKLQVCYNILKTITLRKVNAITELIK